MRFDAFCTGAVGREAGCAALAGLAGAAAGAEACTGGAGGFTTATFFEHPAARTLATTAEQMPAEIFIVIFANSPL
jgi:hypothetical protein